MTQTEYAKASGLTKGRVSQLVKAGMPLTSKEAADSWRGMSAQKRVSPKSVSGTSEAPGPYRPPEVAGPIDKESITADTPQGAYERQKQIERASYALAVNALRNKSMDAGRLVSIHAQAAKNLVVAKQEMLSVAERERALVSGDWVRKIMVEHDGAIVAIARAMPKQLAGRISPHDPEHAERELDRWVQESLLASLHNTNTWK